MSKLGTRALPHLRLWGWLQWTPHFYARSVALLCFGHAALLPALIDAAFVRVLVIALVIEIEILVVVGISARASLKARNRAHCEQEGRYMWKCTRTFCPVDGGWSGDEFSNK